MYRKHDIFRLSRLYLKSYYKFLVSYTDIVSGDEAYSLFMYSIKKLLGLEAIEYNDSIDRYGDKCVEYLGGIEGTPSNDIDYFDKLNIVNVCEGYAKATGMLSSISIMNGRY